MTTSSKTEKKAPVPPSNPQIEILFSEIKIAKKELASPLTSPERKAELTTIIENNGKVIDALAGDCAIDLDRISQRIILNACLGAINIAILEHPDLAAKITELKTLNIPADIIGGSTTQFQKYLVAHNLDVSYVRYHVFIREKLSVLYQSTPIRRQAMKKDLAYIESNASTFNDFVEHFGLNIDRIRKLILNQENQPLDFLVDKYNQIDKSC